jgi:hypothetical protein
MIERALREQQPGNGAGGYMQEMVDFLGQRYLDQKLSDAQANRFFDNALKVQLDMRPIVGVGDPVPFRISTVGRGPAEGWWARASQVGCWVDDKKTNLGTSASTGGFSAWSSTSALRPQPLGEHRLRVAVEMGAGTGNIASVQGPLDHARTLQLTADFRVAADKRSLIWLTSPNAATIRNCLSASSFAVYPGNSQPLQGMIDAANPPTDLAFDVFARANCKEVSLGGVNFRRSPAGNSSYGVAATTLPPGDLRTIDIILRSSEAVAKGTVDLTQIWRGEIVILNVPVRQPLPATQPRTSPAASVTAPEHAP